MWLPLVRLLVLPLCLGTGLIALEYGIPLWGVRCCVRMKGRWANFLRKNGYETGMFGKWHLGDNFPYRPEDRGFTEVYRHGGGGVGQTPDVG